MGYPLEDRSFESLQQALGNVYKIAAKSSIVQIIPMDWHSSEGLLNLAYVVSGNGEVLAYQTKNQLDPTEDHIWIPGTKRQLFELNRAINPILIIMKKQ